MDLKTYCKYRRIHLNQIAKALNVSPQCVSKWATGQTIPSTEHYMRLLEFLKLKPTEVALSRPLWFPAALFGKSRDTIPKILENMDNFSRAYTEHLGLDWDEVLERFDNTDGAF